MFDLDFAKMRGLLPMLLCNLGTFETKMGMTWKNISIKELNAENSFNLRHESKSNFVFEIEKKKRDS